MLFEVAVVEKPSKKAAEEEGAVEKLIMAPIHVMAKDAQSAAIKAIKGFVPNGHGDIDLDKCEVLVRPFGEPS